MNPRSTLLVIAILVWTGCKERRSEPAQVFAPGDNSKSASESAPASTPSILDRKPPRRLTDSERVFDPDEVYG